MRCQWKQRLLQSSHGVLNWLSPWPVSIPATQPRKMNSGHRGSKRAFLEIKSQDKIANRHEQRPIQPKMVIWAQETSSHPA